MKYNSSGHQDWNITWGGAGEDTGEGLVVDNFGDVYVTGSTASYGAGQRDVFLDHIPVIFIQ